MLRNALRVLALSAFAVAAHAQTAGTINFYANTTSATGSLRPVLMWSTSPVATSCTASGGWSGTKFASGSETLPRITANTSYKLTCTWGSGGVAKVSWTPPTKNSDGSSLTNLAGFKVRFGNSTSALTQSKTISDPKATSTTITALPTGTWYFAVRSVNSQQVESSDSNVVQKSISSATAAKTVAITITPTTKKLKTVSTTVYDVLYTNGTSVIGRQVGTVALGVSCNPDWPTSTYYFPVVQTAVKFSRTSRSNTVVARCGWQ